MEQLENQYHVVDEEDYKPYLGLVEMLGYEIQKKTYDMRLDPLVDLEVLRGIVKIM